MSRQPADKDRAAGRPVTDIVAGDALNFAAVIARRVIERDDDMAAGNSLGDAVLREAAEFEIEPVPAPGAEALAGLAFEAHFHAAMIRHPFAAVGLGDQARDRCPRCTVAVTNPEN